MRRVLRENALCALAALAGCAALAHLALQSFAWSDYETEMLPAVEALTRGEAHRFLTLAPVFGGSLIERAPAILLPGLWGGGQLAVYRALAVPGLLACAAIGLWLAAGMRAAGSNRLGRSVALLLCACNPVALIALEYGHSEELLGAALCLWAVLLAARPRLGRGGALAAGALLGLAVANKQWALVAAPAVLLAVPVGLRRWCLLAAGLSAGAVLAPLLLGSSGAFAASSSAAATGASQLFEPWQIWWFLGHHGIVRAPDGAIRPGYRVGPAWIERYSRLLVLAGAAGAGMAMWSALLRRARSCGPARRAAGRLGERDALCALALLLLMRCLLDTWDALYYPLPFLIAMTVWECRTWPRRPPLLSLVAAGLVWAFVEVLHHSLSPDLQAALFLAWTVPLAGWLARRLSLSIRSAPAQPPPAAQETTVSSLGSPVRTSRPSAVTTARSSIRTPSVSGR